ncbi:MAG: ATP-binding protein, partial [Zoogloea sp.]|nr:ATP-binding protein [Zoogloea sp.]
WPYVESGLGHYLLLMGVLAPALAVLVWLLYQQGIQLLGTDGAEAVEALRLAFIKAYMSLLLVSGLVVWWLVLTHKSRQVAQEESNRQTSLLMREIESHRRTDEQLQRAKQAAELANQAKSRYITAISHELRTPLNSILGYAQILDGDDAIPPHRRQAINVIRRSGDHLLSVIEGTLDIARIEGGKLALDVKPIDFKDFLQQIVGMFEVQARNKGLSFRFEPIGEIPPVVRADGKRVRQILINLLGNAVKFTAKGSICLRLTYRMEMATFEVEDTGPGISQAEIERIFDPFSRGTSAQGAGGAGLGLTISRMFADVMGGELTVKSEQGKGSTFRVRLFLPQVRGEVAARELPRNRVGYRGERRRILVVDNERVDREFLITLLEPLGFSLAQAANGQECLRVLPRFKPDLVFMDLAMPGMDGWEVVRRIRAGEGGAEMAAVPVAIISANAYERGLHSDDNDLGIGSNDFFLKPVQVAELLDWTGRRLGLEWLETQQPEAPPPLPADMAYPPADVIAGLAEQVEMGYVKGILRRLDEIEALDAAYAPFVAELRELTRNFRLDAIPPLLDKARHA